MKPFLIYISMMVGIVTTAVYLTSDYYDAELTITKSPVPVVVQYDHVDGNIRHTDKSNFVEDIYCTADHCLSLVKRLPRTGHNPIVYAWQKRKEGKQPTILAPLSEIAYFNFKRTQRLVDGVIDKWEGEQ